MEDHPARPRIAEVLVTKADGPWRGSGYLVAPGWVLTAAHVVADASEVAVWLGAPPTLEPPYLGVGVDPRRILLAKDADLALLPVGRSHTERVEPVLLGRLDRARIDAVPVAAAGCPRFKLRPAPARPGVELRELHLAIGTIVAASDAKTGTLELAVQVVPAEDPEPDKHSPWEGMSGAAVWASGRLVGVVGQHHPRQGPGVLTVRPLTALFEAVTAEELAAWRRTLPQLGARVEDLSPATLPSSRELVEWWAQQEAAELLPMVLVARDEELADLAAFVGSQQRWRWIQAAAFAGKTALLAWFALHPPEGVDVAACFLRRTASRADAGYALSVLTSQLARLADRPDDRPTTALYERVRNFGMLLKDAAQTCQQRGRRLLVLVDGLDEDQTTEPGFTVAKWLPDAKTLPDNAWLLVASRAGVPIPLPDGHPLTGHIRELTVSVAASEIQALAEAELKDARETGGIIYDILGLLAAADGGLTVSDLTELIWRHGQPTVSSVQVADMLAGALARSVSAVANPEALEEPVWVFAHDALLEHARTLYVHDLSGYHVLFDAWAREYQQQGWPPTTPPYLLRPYTRQLASQALDPAGTPERCRQVIELLYQIVTHPARGTVLLQRTGNPAIYDQEIMATQRLLVDVRERGGIDDELELIYRLGVLALARRPFTGMLSSAAITISSVWAQARRFPGALAIAAGIEDVEERDRALARVVSGLAQARQMREAVNVARGIQDRWKRAWVLAGVAGTFAKAGQAGEAIDLARDIENSWPEAHASAKVAGGLAQAGQTAQATNVARDIEAPRQRAPALAEVAGSLAKTGQTAEAAGLVAEAVEIAAGLEAPWQRARALAEVAATLAHAGQAEEAISVARAIQDREEQEQALAGVADNLARAGQAGEAISLARGIQDPRERERTLARVADGLAQAGQAAEAIELAHGIQDPQERARVLAEVADSIAKAGQGEKAADLAAEAAEIAAGLETPQERARALAEVAGSLAKAGQTTEVAGVVAEVVEIARCIQDGGERVRALAELAGTLAQAGQAGEAINVARSTQLSSQRAWVLAQVAGGLAQAGQAAEAIKVARSIEDPEQKAQALARVAGGLAQAGQTAQATNVARNMQASWQRTWVLADVAGTLAQAGQAAAAADLAAEAAEIARGTKGVREWAWALAQVAGGLAQAGQAAEAIEVARSIEDPEQKARALARVAGGLAQAGQAAEAIEVARSIEDPEQKARALARVAGGLAQAGQAAEAIEVARSIENPGQKADALADVAAGLAKAGQAGEAINAAYSIRFPPLRSWALADVAGGLAQAGQAGRAIKVARSIEDPEQKARALAAVARLAEGDGDDGVIHNAVYQVLLSSYARAHLAVIPVMVLKRLLAEGRLIHSKTRPTKS